MLPENLYSIKNEQYLNAFLFYTLQYFIQICVFLTGAEYAIVVVERKMAVYYYDKTESVNDCSTGKRVIFFSVSFFKWKKFINCTGCLIKISVLYYFKVLYHNFCVLQ